MWVEGIYSIIQIAHTYQILIISFNKKSEIWKRINKKAENYFHYNNVFNKVFKDQNIKSTVYIIIYWDTWSSPLCHPVMCPNNPPRPPQVGLLASQGREECVLQYSFQVFLHSQLIRGVRASYWTVG